MPKRDPTVVAIGLAKLCKFRTIRHEGKLLGLFTDAVTASELQQMDNSIQFMPVEGYWVDALSGFNVADHTVMVSAMSLGHVIGINPLRTVLQHTGELEQTEPGAVEKLIQYAVAPEARIHRAGGSRER